MKFTKSIQCNGKSVQCNDSNLLHCTVLDTISKSIETKPCYDIGFFSVFDFAAIFFQTFLYLRAPRVTLVLATSSVLSSSSSFSPFSRHFIVGRFHGWASLTPLLPGRCGQDCCDVIAGPYRETGESRNYTKIINYRHSAVTVALCKRLHYRTLYNLLCSSSIPTWNAILTVALSIHSYLPFPYLFLLLSILLSSLFALLLPSPSLSSSPSLCFPPLVVLCSRLNFWHDFFSLSFLSPFYNEPVSFPLPFLSLLNNLSYKLCQTITTLQQTESWDLIHSMILL